MTKKALALQKSAELEKSKALIDSAPILIRLGLIALKESIKTPTGKKKMRGICLEAFLSLRDTYAGDKAFK